MASPTEKVWLITGVSSGIGRALAEYVLSQGDKVRYLPFRHKIYELTGTGHRDRQVAVKIPGEPQEGRRTAAASRSERIRRGYSEGWRGIVEDLRKSRCPR